MQQPSIHTNAQHITEQYSTDENLRARYETHDRYTVGPHLEPAVDEAVKLRGDEALLDLGTGPGGYPARLIEQGHCGRIVGVDQSPGMIAKARATCPRGEFLLANAEQLPFEDESFDVVTARHMLYHVPDIAKALREIHRVLRNGGRFLAVTNSIDYMQEYVDAIRESMTLLPETLARELGEMVSTSAAAAFTEINGEPLIRDAFGNVEVRLLQSQLVFEQAHPMIRYFNSSRTMKGISRDDWKAIETAMRQVIESRVKGGSWAVSKRVVLLTSKKN